MDCSDNEELKQSVIQCAIDRGNDTLSTTTDDDDTSYARASSLYYLSSSSSSGDSSSQNDDTNSSITEGVNATNILQPKQMTKQVGGHPILVFDKYILKPLRLSSAGSSSHCNHDNNVINTKAKASSDYKDGIKDKTKVYRGVREIAFYEALQYVSTSILSSENKISPHSHDSSSADLLQQSSYTSFIQSCRYPTIPYTSTRRQFAINSSLSNIGYFNSLVLAVAYYARDPVVTSSLQSYTQACYIHTKEMQALKQLSAFTSTYYGVLYPDAVEQRRQQNDSSASSTQTQPLQQQHQQQPYLILQNMILPYHRPNIIDIKMGTQTYEPSAPLSKQLRERAKYPQQSEFGFRIVGMRVYMPNESGEYKSWDKSFGPTLTTREDVMYALMTYFCCNHDTTPVINSHTHCVLKSIIKQLTSLKTWFEDENDTLVFYASSILIVYEGSSSISSSGSSSSVPYQEPIVKMIDFAHVCRHTGGDAGYLKGICNLLSILDEMKSIIE